MMRLWLAGFLAFVSLACSAHSPTAIDLFNRARGGDANAIARLRAAAEAGDADSQFQLGRAYSHAAGVGRDDAAAASWIEKAAAQGHLEAQSNIGYAYSVGQGVPRDPQKAIAWWTRAAEAGFVEAQFNLALTYLEGKLTARDDAKAFAWMSKAAAQGNALAQAHLAGFYRAGTGTAQNMTEAAAWYRKAAEQGNDVAAFNLALMYERGEGDAPDPAAALHWARRAVARGYARAIPLESRLCRDNADLCARSPTPTHFVFEMSDPKVRIVIPDAPPMAMGPHPLAQPHTRFMGNGPDGFTISVLVPTADQGMSAMDCARSRAASVAQRFRVRREDAVLLHTNVSTLVMLFPLKVEPRQLKAFLLSGAGGTHCIEVHLSRMLMPGAAAEDQSAAWMLGFRRAHIENY